MPRLWVLILRSQQAARLGRTCVRECCAPSRHAPLPADGRVRVRPAPVCPTAPPPPPHSTPPTPSCSVRPPSGRTVRVSAYSHTSRPFAAARAQLPIPLRCVPMLLGRIGTTAGLCPATSAPGLESTFARGLVSSVPTSAPGTLRTPHAHHSERAHRALVSWRRAVRALPPGAICRSGGCARMHPDLRGRGTPPALCRNHARAHTRAYAHTHTHTHPPPHACTHAQPHACAHARLRTPRACAHTLTRHRFAELKRVHSLDTFETLLFFVLQQLHECVRRSTAPARRRAAGSTSHAFAIAWPLPLQAIARRLVWCMLSVSVLHAIMHLQLFGFAASRQSGDRT